MLAKSSNSSLEVLVVWHDVITQLDDLTAALLEGGAQQQRLQRSIKRALTKVLKQHLEACSDAKGMRGSLHVGQSPSRMVQTAANDWLSARAGKALLLAGATAWWQLHAALMAPAHMQQHAIQVSREG
jgi:hypothetical protein